MKTPNLFPCAALVTLAMVTPAFGQDSTSPRTPDGQPNIQGVWTNFDPTPFDAPDDIDLERLAPLARWFPGTNQPQRPPVDPSPDARSRGPQGPWGDGPGDALRNERRRSMVVDPPSGRAPLRDSAIAKRNQNLVNLTDGWLTHTPWERCITRGIPGGMFPGGYGAGYQILQVPGYVVILYEMVHEARVIPIDDRPPLSENIRLWNGNPRGRWEGETLVVSTSRINYPFFDLPPWWGIPQTEAIEIVERFTLDGDTLVYDFSAYDPTTFTEPIDKPGFLVWTWQPGLEVETDKCEPYFEDP